MLRHREGHDEAYGKGLLLDPSFLIGLIGLAVLVVLIAIRIPIAIP
jgi:preprotein translocase subunit Sec61beta